MKVILRAIVLTQKSLSIAIRELKDSFDYLHE